MIDGGHILKGILTILVLVSLMTVGVGAFTVGLYFTKTPPSMILSGKDNPVSNYQPVKITLPPTTIPGATTTTLSGSPTTTTFSPNPTTTTRPSGASSTTTIRQTSTSTVVLGILVDDCSCSSAGVECFSNCGGFPSGYSTGAYQCIDGSCYFKGDQIPDFDPSQLE